jgi:hypothetical protein
VVSTIHGKSGLKMLVNDSNFGSDIFESKKKIGTAIGRLKVLKSQVSELREQCEAMKKNQSEKAEMTFETFVCEECGKQISEDNEVTIKASSGKVISHYHKDCFKKMWRSEAWKFDYTSPGFLRISDKGH